MHQFNKIHGALQNYTATEGVEQINTGENMFRQVNPEQPLLHMKVDEASCDEANNNANNVHRGGCNDSEPPLRLFVEQELPRSLFDNQSVNGEMHKDVR